MITKHAVLTNDHVVMIDSATRKIQRVASNHPLYISDLWIIGQDLCVTHFWPMPGSSFDSAGYDALDEPMEGQSERLFNIFVTKDKNGQRFDEPQSARCRMEDNAGHEILLCYPHRGDFAWQIGKPLDILAAI